MRTARNFFLHRVFKEWKFQIGVWRTAIDWIVALYMVVPALFVVIKLNIDWWHGGLAWPLPFGFFSSLIFIFSLNGQIRLFVEEADQLFLVQLGSWRKQLTTLSLAYSLLMNLILTGLVFVYLAPVFVLLYHLSWLELSLFALFAFLFKSALGLSKQLLSLRFHGWGERLARWLIYLVSGVFYQASMFLLTHFTGLFALPVVFVVALLALLLYRRINVRGSFGQDVAREQSIKLRYASLFLRAAMVYTKKNRTVAFNNRPLLFRRSTPLFKERSAPNLLTEACLKSVLRSKSRLLTYGQLVVLCAAVILAFPLNWKWIAWFGFSLLLAKFVELFWRETRNSPVIQLFPWQKEDQGKAAGKAIFYLMLIGFLPLSLILGFEVYPWYEALALLPAGAILGYYVSKVVAAFS